MGKGKSNPMVQVPPLCSGQLKGDIICCFYWKDNLFLISKQISYKYFTSSKKLAFPRYSGTDPSQGLYKQWTCISKF